MSGKVFWDTNLFIYLFEGSSAFSEDVEQIIKYSKTSNSSIVASSLTLAELLVKPIKEQKSSLVEKYKLALSSLEIVTLDFAAAIAVAEIRANHNIKIPDAIQLACAKVCGARLFITNDERLSMVKIDGLEILSLSGFVERLKEGGAR